MYIHYTIIHICTYMIREKEQYSYIKKLYNFIIKWKKIYGIYGKYEIYIIFPLLFFKRYI